MNIHPFYVILIGVGGNGVDMLDNICGRRSEKKIVEKEVNKDD
jgi:hypothetical protein